MLASLALLLGLPLALAAEPPTCAPLVPVTFDNATVARIWGNWNYIAGATKYRPHVADLKALKYVAYSILPGSHEDELIVVENIRLNETCIMKNNSKFHVIWDNSTLMHGDDQVTGTAEVMQSDEDLLILKHFNNDFVGLSLLARTPNVSKEQLEEFRAQLHCLGFTEEEIFFTSAEHACPLAGEKKDEGEVEKDEGEVEKKDEGEVEKKDGGEVEKKDRGEVEKKDGGEVEP